MAPSVIGVNKATEKKHGRRNFKAANVHPKTAMEGTFWLCVLGFDFWCDCLFFKTLFFSGSISGMKRQDINRFRHFILFSHIQSVWWSNVVAPSRATSCRIGVQTYSTRVDRIFKNRNWDTYKKIFIKQITSVKNKDGYGICLKAISISVDYWFGTTAHVTITHSGKGPHIRWDPPSANGTLQGRLSDHLYLTLCSVWWI